MTSFPKFSLIRETLTQSVTRHTGKWLFGNEMKTEFIKKNKKQLGLHRAFFCRKSVSKNAWGKRGDKV